MAVSVHVCLIPHFHSLSLPVGMSIVEFGVLRELPIQTLDDSALIIGPLTGDAALELASHLDVLDVPHETRDISEEYVLALVDSPAKWDFPSTLTLGESEGERIVAIQKADRIRQASLYLVHGHKTRYIANRWERRAGQMC